MPNKSRTEVLSEEELEYYSRQIVLKEMGYKGQLKLKGAKACIVGLGGLGCSIATQLTAMGVGHLRLVDRDIVELSNLQRQHLYTMNALGYPKVEVAARRLRDLNPNVELEPLPFSMNAETAEKIIRGIDVVIDGLDRMEPRYAVNRACVKLGVPYVFGAAIMTYGNVSTIIPGETPCLECFYGNLKDEALPTCAVVGVHPSVINLVASIEVAEAIRILLGERPNLASRLLYCDLEALSMDEVSLSRLEDCPVCGAKPRGPPAPLAQSPVEEICGRGGKRTFIINPRKNLELDMTGLHRLLKERNFNILVKADLGITFNPAPQVTTSLLKSGVMITVGAKDKEEALKLYESIVT
ncbi:MAG: HesA/MoeB/ThiF family protein [Candidatus Bathyarchaeia archaeon]